MKCNYCGKDITGAYFIDFWNNKIHVDHENEYSKHCCCCHSLIIPSAYPGPIDLNDGRWLCGFCNYDSVNTEKKKIQAVSSVVSLFSKGGLFFPADRININLCNAGEMYRKTCNQYVLGLTTTECGYSIKNKYQIDILAGLNQTFFEGVLSHEFMHVLQDELKINLSLKECEGLCELASYFLYKTKKSTIATSKIQAMENNPDPIYGEGFNIMKNKAQKFGSLQNLLHSLT